MRPPLQFPSFHALVMAMGNDPLLLMQSETVTVGGTIYAARHVTLHTEFQIALRQLTGAAQNSASDQQAADASASSTGIQQFQPSSPANADDQLLAEINTWLAEQQSSASRPRVPTPPPFDPDSDVDWLDIEHWVDEQVRTPPAADVLAPDPAEELLPPEIADLEQLIADSAEQASSALRDLLTPQQPTAPTAQPFRSLNASGQAERLQQAAKLFRQGFSLDDVRQKLTIPHRVLAPYRRQVLGQLPTKKLTAEQHELLRIMVQSSVPSTHNLVGDRWNTFLIQKLIEKLFRVTVNDYQASCVFRYITMESSSACPRSPTLPPSQSPSAQESTQQYDEANVSVTEITKWLTSSAAATPFPTGSDDGSVLPNPVDLDQWLAEQMGESVARQLPSATTRSAALRSHRRPFSALDDDQKAQRCYEAYQLLIAKWNVHRVAVELNIPRPKVKQWYQQLDTAGALTIPKLSTQQLQTLKQLIDSNSPLAFGYQTTTWDRWTVSTFIQKHFNIELPLLQVDQILRQFRSGGLPTAAYPPTEQSYHRTQTVLQIPRGPGVAPIELSWTSSRSTLNQDTRDTVMQALINNMHYAKAANFYGLQVTTVHTWKQRLQADNKMVANTEGALNTVQVEIITAMMQQQRPEDHLFDGNEWNYENLLSLVSSTFGIRLTQEALRAYFPTLPAGQADQTGTTAETNSAPSIGSTPPTSDDTQQ